MFNCYGCPVSIGLIESQEMLGSLDGRFPTPERFVTVPTVEVAREKKNTDLISWTKLDRLLPWITAMLLEEVCRWVVGNFC